MNQFAQIPSAVFEGPVCALYNDHWAILVSVWLGLLASSLVLFGVFGFIKYRKISMSFFAYFISLVLARILFSADGCGHGGLFSGEGPYVLLPIFILIVGTFVYGIYKQVRIKRITKQ